MVEAPPVAGAPTPPLLCSPSQYHNCFCNILMLIVTVFLYFLLAVPCIAKWNVNFLVSTSN